MDRRLFLKGWMGSGALGAMPLAAHAGMSRGGPRDARPVVIVGQADLPQARVFARSIAGSLDAAGLSSIYLSARSDQLGSYAGVAAILDRTGPARLIGVMDDACALLFQQIAAARGAGWLMQTQHRIGGGEPRHCCSVAGMESSLVWADAPQRVARLYAQAVGGRRVPESAELAAANAMAVLPGGPASLVSFAINT